MFIPPSGPLTAKIAIVGEKPGEEEIRKGEPFVGASGIQLNELLAKIGISRNQVYVTNAVKNVTKIGNPTRQEIEAEQLALFRELTKLPNCNVIVPMGNCALQSLSNFQLNSITSYRGSILPTFFGRKMIPTFHPAFYMRGEWRMKSVVQFDLRRALEESYAREINVPTRRCFIAQNRSDLEDIRSKFCLAEFISFDIELLRGRFIECIAFSREPSEAYCIPITNGRRKALFSPADEFFAWQVIQSILSQEKTIYVTQNGLFDCWHLWRHGIKTPYMASGFDTMLMHRLRAPDLPHDLGFLTSIYTKEPYYKDESGDWTLQNRVVSDEQFWAYNCKDAAVTLEVCQELIKDLHKQSMLENFRTEVQRQWAAITKMRQKGIKIDQAALTAAKEFIFADISSTQAKIKSAVGWLPNTKSSIDMEKLYVQLGIRFDRTPKGKAKTDIERIYTYAANNPQHRETLYNIADLNSKRTLQSGFTSLALDSGGFYHPALDITKTKTGRLASKGADEGGPQIQNVPKRIRNIFVPDDEESEIINADLSGAETWIQAFVAKDKLLIAALRQGVKVHNVRGCLIYRNWTSDSLPPRDLLNSILKVCPACAAIGEKECNHSEYYMSKQSGHALAYREGPRRFCHEQRKKGIFINESFAKEVRAKVITRSFHEWHINVEDELRRTSWLTTPLGRRRQFYGLFDDTLLNQALSWYCQATVGQITNRAMIWLDKELEEKELKARILTQTHDSLTLSAAKVLRDEVRKLLSQAFTCPITIHNETFQIPLEITYGPNWRDLNG